MDRLAGLIARGQLVRAISDAMQPEYSNSTLQLYFSVIPPSTTSSMPVTYFDSSDAR